MITKTEVRCKHCGGSGTNWIVDPDSLKETRIKAGVSLRSFARKLGLSAAYLCDIELGRRACTFIIESAYSNLRKLKQTTQPRKTK